MLLPFGILASSGAGPAGAMELISTTVVSTPVTSLTFSSIPQTYKHLQVRTTWHENTSGYVFVTANGHSSASSTAVHYLTGNGTTVASAGNTNWPGYWFNGFAGAIDSNGTSVFSAGIIDVLDYTQTTKAKTYRMFSGGPTTVGLTSALDTSLEAVNTLLFWTGGAATFSAGTRFSIYGIKG